MRPLSFLCPNGGRTEEEQCPVGLPPEIVSRSVDGHCRGNYNDGVFRTLHVMSSFQQAQGCASVF